MSGDGDGLVPLRFAEALERPPLDPRATAVLVIDMVRHQLTPGRWLLGDVEARGGDIGYLVDRVTSVTIPAQRRLLDAVRRSGGVVAHLRIGSMRPDHADATRQLRALFERWEAHVGSPSMEVVPELRPEPGDLDLVKTGSDAFVTSALDEQLRARGVEHVLYTGVVTSSCVLSTLTTGFDLGYYGWLVADATATYSAALQAAAEALVGSRAVVTSTDAVVADLMCIDNV